jgi:hypothetical protein
MLPRPCTTRCGKGFAMRKVVWVLGLGFIGFVVVVSLVTQDKGGDSPATPKAKPMEERAVAMARDWYQKHESKMFRVNPNISHRTWCGNYNARRMGDYDHVWIVTYKGDRSTKFCEWRMVMFYDPEENNWGLIRVLVCPPGSDGLRMVAEYDYKDHYPDLYVYD